MPTIVDPREAQELIAKGDIDLIDVREPNEWAEGHIPGARNVPLADIQGGASDLVHGKRVLFVCARGARSLTASKAAEQFGIPEVWSLDGGTQAWQSAGLRIERPRTEIHSAPPPPVSPSGPPPGPATDPNHGAPDPALDAIIGENVRKFREQQGISLDDLARTTGLSRTVLGQIELGRTTSSVAVVWKLARAFDVHFSALLGTAEHYETSLLRASKAKRLVSPDGRFSSRALCDLSDKSNVEFYELTLSGHSREDAQPHQSGTRENLIVSRGRLELHIGAARFDLETGDAIVFTADVEHSYVNPGSEECTMYLVMTYAMPNLS